MKANKHCKGRLGIFSLVAVIMSLLIMPSFTAKADTNNGDTNVVLVSDADEFYNAISSAVDGRIVRLANDIWFKRMVTIPQNCLVTIDLNGHTMYNDRYWRKNNYTS